jgi:hypothetical protein
MWESFEPIIVSFERAHKCFEPIIKSFEPIIESFEPIIEFQPGTGRQKWESFERAHKCFLCIQVYSDHCKEINHSISRFPLCARNVSTSKSALTCLFSVRSSLFPESVQFTDSQESPPAFQGYDGSSREEAYETLKASSGILPSNAQKKFV